MCFFLTDGFLDCCSRLSPSFGPYHFYLSVKISRFTLIIQRQRTLIHSMKSQSFLFLFHNNGFGTINGFLVYGLYLSQYNAVNMYWGDEAKCGHIVKELSARGQRIKSKHTKAGDALPLPCRQRFCSSSRCHFLKPALSWLHSLLAAALPSGCCTHNP